MLRSFLDRCLGRCDLGWLPPLTPYWRLLLEGLQDVTMLMLLASAAVSLVLGLAFFSGRGRGSR
jgi:hypothetical protein